MASSFIQRLSQMMKWGCLGLLLLFLLVVAIAALSNLGLPKGSRVVDRLSDLEKARLHEVFHLRHELGEAVWPGWSQADIPVILYNESYAFIVGYPSPPPGWFKMPSRLPRGGAWEVVPGDQHDGQSYYRQPLPDSKRTPEAFTVLVGDRWAASMQTKEWMSIALRKQVRADVPWLVKPIIPYRLISALFLGSSDVYVSAVLHESFHAFQGMAAPARLEASENAVRQFESGYPWDDPGSKAAWNAELNLLAEGLRVEARDDTARLARQFLAQRTGRRSEHRLDSRFVDYERQREWLEGLGKYVELEVWRQASVTKSYRPVQPLSADPDFEHYRTFHRRWTQEVAQIGRSTNAHDGRFYYSGMAQAFLLDRLAPGWKDRAMAEGVWLEDLLREACDKK